jgi:hypothetical protein
VSPQIDFGPETLISIHLSITQLWGIVVFSMTSLGLLFQVTRKLSDGLRNQREINKRVTTIWEFLMRRGIIEAMQDELLIREPKKNQRDERMSP